MGFRYDVGLERDSAWNLVRELVWDLVWVQNGIGVRKVQPFISEKGKSENTETTIFYL